MKFQLRQLRYVMCALPDTDALSTDHALLAPRLLFGSHTYGVSPMSYGGMVWFGGPLCPFVNFFQLLLPSRCGGFFAKQQQSNSKCNYNATSTHFLHSLCAELRVWSHAKLVWQMLFEHPGHAHRPSPLAYTPLFFRSPGTFIIFCLPEHCVAAVKRSIGALFYGLLPSFFRQLKWQKQKRK